MHTHTHTHTHTHRAAPFHVQFVALRAVLPEARVHIHEEFLHVEGQTVHGAVPVLRSIGFERRIEHRENHITALSDERYDVLVIPQEKRPLGDLEVGRIYAAGNEAEKRLGDLCKVRRLRELEELLKLVEEHHLLGAVGVRPVLDEASQDDVG